MFETGRRCQSEEGADELSDLGCGSDDGLGGYNGVDGVDGVDGTKGH